MRREPKFGATEGQQKEDDEGNLEIDTQIGITCNPELQESSTSEHWIQKHTIPAEVHVKQDHQQLRVVSSPISCFYRRMLKPKAFESPRHIRPLPRIEENKEFDLQRMFARPESYASDFTSEECDPVAGGDQQSMTARPDAASDPAPLQETVHARPSGGDQQSMTDAAAYLAPQQLVVQSQSESGSLLPLVSPSSEIVISPAIAAAAEQSRREFYRQRRKKMRLRRRRQRAKRWRKRIEGHFESFYSVLFFSVFRCLFLGCFLITIALRFYYEEGKKGHYIFVGCYAIAATAALIYLLVTQFMKILMEYCASAYGLYKFLVPIHMELLPLVGLWKITELAAQYGILAAALYGRTDPFTATERKQFRDWRLIVQLDLAAVLLHPVAALPDVYRLAEIAVSRWLSVEPVHRIPEWSSACHSQKFLLVSALLIAVAYLVVIMLSALYLASTASL